MVDTLEGDGAAMTPPSLIGWTTDDAPDFPGAALEVPGNAEDGDTFFAAISPTPAGTIISNTAIFALVVGDESNACVHWGGRDLWDGCGGGGALILIILLLAVAAGAYFFLM